MKPGTGAIAVLLLCASLTRAADRPRTSRLWGDGGELWSAESRLPDFSWAGYRGGAKPIPDVPVKANVKDLGAIGDGAADDTAAFLKAIGTVDDGAILVPAGRYKITSQLRVRKRGVVLRGAGRDKTVLFFPRSLTEAVGPGKGHAPSNSWSWSGGYLSFEGWDIGTKQADVTAPARRGERRLKVSTAAKLMPGQWVRLMMTDPDGSLARHLHADRADGSKAYRGRKLVEFSSPIESIDGDSIVLARPLRTDARLEWKPEVFASNPTVQEVGVEDLTIEFPETPYAGHHDEPGYNAVCFQAVTNGWVRRVRFVNADSGVFFQAHTKFCTAESLLFSAAPGRLRLGYGRDKGEPQTLPVAGHHAILLEDFAQDNLIQGFRLETRYVHDTSVSAWASGNVFSDGGGVDMSIDHHRRASYENLFTALDAGDGSRLWETGGDLEDGPPAGARETFWGIRAAHPPSAPAWAIEANFVGVAGADKSPTPEDAGNYWEPLAPESLSPANLYAAQRARRGPS